MRLPAFRYSGRYPYTGASAPTRGFEPIGSTPEEFDAQIKAEIEKWAKIVRDANVKTQLRVECASSARRR
jgi:hypothetical protein